MTSHLITTLMTVGLLTPCLAKDFFIAPAIDDCVSDSPCYTLDQYASNASLFNGYSNISLVFMSGVHNLSHSLHVIADHLEFKGIEPKDTTIHLQELISIQSTYLHLSNIQLMYGNETDPTDKLIHALNISAAYVVNVTARHIKIRLDYSDSINLVNSVFSGQGEEEFQQCLYSCYEIDNAGQCVYDCHLMAGTIAVGQAYNVSITNSYFTNNPIGLFLGQADTVSIKNSHFTNNHYFGLFLNYVDNVSVKNSQFTNNINGFYVIRAGSVSFENSHFTDNKVDGMYVDEADNVLVKTSHFNSNHQNGLHVRQADSVSIETSHFMNNRDGLDISCTENVIKSSRFTNNSRNGLYIGGQANSVTVENSHFTNNRKGMHVIQAYDALIESSHFTDNFNGVYIGEAHNMSVEESYFVNSQNALSLGHADSVLIENLQFTDNRNGLYGTADSMSVKNSNFVRNAALGAFIWAAETVLMQNLTLIGPDFEFGLLLYSIRNVTITDSLIMSGRIGIASFRSALTIQNAIMTNNNFGVVIVDADLLFGSVVVINNMNTMISTSDFSSHKVAALVLINAPENTVVTHDCNFTENQGTPVLVYQSTITLEGEHVFRDNTAERGGGLALFNAKVIFSPGSNTTFLNNQAREFGGAIFTSTILIPLPQLFVTMENIEDAFLRNLLKTIRLLQQSCFHSTSEDSHVNFTGNTAVQGGHDIYGPTLYSDDCLVTDNPAFTFDENILNSLQVSSDPGRVCFCVNNTHQCEDRAQLVHTEMRYPGESFKVSVTLAGYDYGRVAGLVYANVLGGHHTEVLRDDQHIQAVTLTELCTELEYTVSSNTSDKIELVLTATERFTQESSENEIETAIIDTNSTRCREGPFPCTAFLTTPIYIRVTLEECPLGFQLNNNTRCECDRILNNISNVTCTIHDRKAYINRQGRVWVGVDTRENTTDIYHWHVNCPSDYCNISNVSVELTNPDVQCSLNRSGMLCGGCQANHSLMLGGNKCSKECRNHSIAWILVFAVFGVLLVVLIKVLDLTVANGTVNGLIFYANVVWANRAILFSLQDRQSMGYYITVPIAWINLDFGIEICFIQDLDQLTKTGLQFVFPVYIWCIAGLIILISHYSTKATKLFGNNSVAVLATLFLLSYGKLVRNITDVFNYADIMNSNLSTRKVWSLDGNVRYGTGGHIVLQIFALVFLVLVLLFTSTLLLVPLLRGMSDRQPFQWINKLKPFFDTFYGPFKDKKQHHLWTSILLISRVIILIVFAATSTISPEINILLMAVLSVFLLMYSASVGLLYKKWTVSFLENSYILNLNILGIAFLIVIIYGQGTQLNPVTATSVCIALFQFTCILIGHLVKQVLSIEKVQSWINTRQEMQRDIEGDNNDIHVPMTDRQAGVTYQVVEIPKYRCEYDTTKYREELLETNA